MQEKDLKNYSIRTDLVVDMMDSNFTSQKIISKKETFQDIQILEVTITSDENELKKKKGKYISYIGIAADEPKRLKRLKENECSMLEKWNMTEQDCLEFLKRRNLENPLYENHKRLGCWFCPKQRIETLKI